MNERHLIALVDGNEDDLFLMKRAFRAVGVANPIITFSNFERYLAYLRGSGVYADREKHPLLKILVLDLTARPHDWLELLDETRKVPGLEHVPVVAFTSSEEGPQVQKAYDRGANAVFTKGNELNSMAQTIRDLEFLEDILSPKVEGVRSMKAA